MAYRSSPPSEPLTHLSQSLRPDRLVSARRFRSRPLMLAADRRNRPASSRAVAPAADSGSMNASSSDLKGRRSGIIARQQASCDQRLVNGHAARDEFLKCLRPAGQIHVVKIESEPHRRRQLVG